MTIGHFFVIHMWKSNKKCGKIPLLNYNFKIREKK